MNLGSIFNSALTLIGILLMIFQENCEAGSFYPTFKKVRPSLARFKSRLSRSRFQTIQNFRPYRINEIRNNVKPRKSKYWS